MKNGKKLLAELQTRGLVEHHSGGDLTEIFAVKRKVYLGIDPTADSIHMGNLVPIILMKHLADAGHTPHLLVGGGTGMIGDPRQSGERVLLDEKTLKKNIKAVKGQLEGVLQRKITVFNNLDWLGKVKMIDFLRDVGKHFTVNQLVKRDIIKRRLETDEDSISYTEFSYSLLQAYDYHHLYQKHGVDLQIGGTDQWANIISGVDLIRRREQGEAYALTTPMVIDKTTGKKFGKSEGNAVWLDPEKTSPFAFYQFWINVADENVANYLRLFSFSTLAKIDKTIAAHEAEPHKRQAQQLLARDMTTFVHGAEITKSIEKISKIIYGAKTIPKLTELDQALIVKEVPSLKLTKRQASSGVSIVDVLLETGLATSKKNARQLIGSNAVSVQGKTVEESFMLDATRLKDGLALVKKGKKVAAVHR